MRKRSPIRFIFISVLLFYFAGQINAQQRDVALRRIDSLITVLPKQKEDSTKALILINIVTAKLGEAQHTGNWDDPIEWGHKALNFSLKVNFRWGIGRSYWNLGLCWKQKGNYVESIKYFSEALKTSFKNRNKLLGVASYQYMGDCYMSLGNYYEVIKISQEGLATLSQMDPENGQLIVAKELFSLKTGNAYAKLHNYSEALSWYEKVLLKHESEEIRIQMASVQMEMKNYDEALKNLLIALPLFSSRINVKPETDYEGILGNFYMRIGEVYCKIGSMKRDSERIYVYKEAVNYLNKSVPLLQGGAAGKEDLINAYTLLKEAYEATNDYQNALKFTNLYLDVREALYSKAIYLKLANLRIQLESEKAFTQQKVQKEKEQAEEKALREKLLADQMLQQEKNISEQKILSKNEISEQKIKQAEDKAEFEKTLAIEKAAQQNIKTEQQRKNILVMIGAGGMVMSSIFLLLFLRQSSARKRAIEKAESIHKMAELEMQSLRSQLNPHFMFNSLNSIQELILMEENDKSHSYLSRFGKLLRMLLENAEKPFIPVNKEISFLELYLALENLRIPDLQYSISIDPKLNIEKTVIPNMILQPYIENAIWHGLSHKEKDKQLQIRIYRENETINYEIEDNGVGRKKAEELKSLFRKQHQSKGMELLSKRFKLLNEQYNSDIHTTVADIRKNNEISGTLVTIKVPVKLSEPQLN